MKTKVKAGFEFDAIKLSLTSIHPIRQLRPSDKAWGKYHAIISSIKEVGLIEPLVVFPQRGSRGHYVLLDGHLRLRALQELSHTEALCLVSSDDDAFTYNDKVNRLSVIQEHAMITRAIAHGITPEQIAKALSVDLAKVRSSVNLLDGIDRDVVELLKAKPIAARALKLFARVKPERQMDMAQLMVSSSNFTYGYAEALVVGTSARQMVDGAKAKTPRGITEEEVARMEREMEKLEQDYRLHQDNFGENALHLNAAQRYAKRLLDNTKVKRFMTSRYPELMEELQELTEMQSL